MNPSDSRTSQTVVIYSHGLLTPVPTKGRRSNGSLRFLIGLSMPAVLNHPGERDRCLCSLLGDRWQASSDPAGLAVPNCVTRPKQVHLRYG